jgi:hypothetical protein
VLGVAGVVVCFVRRPLAPAEPEPNSSIHPDVARL